MVGLAIVSHSSKLAEGLYELTNQLSHGKIKIATAGGMSDGSIGTDAVSIAAAVRKAEDGDGVLIIADLGSAILSSDMAMELLDEEQKGRIVIADAPFVEGGVAAAVEASLGSDLERVKEAAQAAKGLRKL